MRKKCKSRTKPIILTILICFVTVNVFPYDIIGIMIEDSKENAELKDAYLLVRKGYEESLDSLGKYEVIRESEEEEFYLLKRGGLTEEGIDSMYKELNGKDYNNIFMLDTPDYSGEFNIQKGKLHRAGNRDLIRNLTTTSVIFLSGVTALFYANNEIKLKIGLLTLPYLLINLIELKEILAVYKMNKKTEVKPIDNYEQFINGKYKKDVKNRILNPIELLFAVIGLNFYSVLLTFSDLFDEDDYYAKGNTARYIILLSEIITYLCSILTINNFELVKDLNNINKYRWIGANYE